MEICFADTIPDTGALAILVAAGPIEEGALTGIHEASRPLVRKAAAAQRFAGKAGEIAEIFADIDGQVRRVLLAGRGDDAFEEAGAAIAARLMTSGETDVAILLDREDAASAAAVATGVVLRSWRYDRYRTELKEAERMSLAKATIVGGGAGAREAWEREKGVADAVLFARMLVTEPGNVVYPETFVDLCRPLGDLGVKMTVLDEAEMEALGMNALLGVARGSAKPPRLLAMEWKGADSPPIALVGKGVTFDTGGISIKPAASMDEMKADMGGAAAVAGTMMALASRRAKAHVIGVCALVENMPDGKAMRPGDVVTTMSGRTVEVLNTDAEGRLVLCDALHWVQHIYAPATVIDLATLTGAIVVALGTEFAGLYSNDDELASGLLAAGTSTGDRLWRMPLDHAYDKDIASEIADVQNLGPRGAGSVTAAHFLKGFVSKDVKWAHLDIAGTAWKAKAGKLHGKGATGFGVRLLDSFLAERLFN